MGEEREEALGQRFHIFRGNIGENGFVTGADNEVGPQEALDPDYFLMNLLRCSVNEQFLRINAAHEGDAAFEILGEPFGVHVGRQSL